jgi:hypothetical protein
MADDSIFAIPNALADAGVKFSEKALQVLQIHSDLDSYSQTLHDSLPNEKSQLTIDKFWANWSTQLLNMADEIESIAVLLGNAAIEYIKTDAAIAKAFHGDKAEQDKLSGEIQQIKDDQNTFKTKFADEQKVDSSVKQQVKTETQDVQKQDEQAAASEQAFYNTVTWSLGDV